MHGYGTFRYGNGDIYEGQWMHDKVRTAALSCALSLSTPLSQKVGYGVMKYPHHGLYMGEFRDDQPWGRGVFHLLNGDHYEGEFRKGLYHTLTEGERSTLLFANGDKYVGEFKEGRQTGRGTFWYNEGKRKGDVYEGEFFEDFRQGKVTDLPTV